MSNRDINIDFRRDFVKKHLRGSSSSSANVQKLARRFGVHPRTIYKDIEYIKKLDLMQGKINGLT